MHTVLEGGTTAPEALWAQSALWNDEQARMCERDEELRVMHLAWNEEDVEATRRAMEQAEELLEDQSIAMRVRQPESIRWQEEREEATSLSFTTVIMLDKLWTKNRLSTICPLKCRQNVDK